MKSKPIRGKKMASCLRKGKERLYYNLYDQLSCQASILSSFILQCWHDNLWLFNFSLLVLRIRNNSYSPICGIGPLQLAHHVTYFS